MNIFHQESFWLILYMVMAIISGATFWYLVERDQRRHEKALVMGLETDGGEYGWSPGQPAVLVLIVIFWPIAWIWLIVIAIYYFFQYSLTWYMWRTAAWAWFKDCCLAVWSWRPTLKAKEERVTRRAVAIKKAETRKRKVALKAEAKAK